MVLGTISRVPFLLYIANTMVYATVQYMLVLCCIMQVLCNSDAYGIPLSYVHPLSILCPSIRPLHPLSLLAHVVCISVLLRDIAYTVI